LFDLRAVNIGRMHDERRAELEQVYRSTHYVVRRGGGDLVIVIGTLCPALDELIKDRGSTSWAFLTAWNPYSRQLSGEENALRQNTLFEKLGSLGLSFLHGAGQDPLGKWPPEESVLIIGAELETAVPLAKEFQQNAIVFGRIGEPAELIWCV
jgi:hypothetical protein